MQVIVVPFSQMNSTNLLIQFQLVLLKLKLIASFKVIRCILQNTSRNSFTHALLPVMKPYFILYALAVQTFEFLFTSIFRLNI
jgi:hypothetical protein